MKPWPLNIPYKPTPEEEAEYEAIIARIEAGNFETRPLTPEETAHMKRLQSHPVSASIVRRSEDTFQVNMRCRGCGAKDSFDQNSPGPWIERRDRFNAEHKDHRVER